MATTMADHSKPNGLARETSEKRTPRENNIDKFAEARRARKMLRRARHRAKLKRSHTNG